MDVREKLVELQMQAKIGWTKEEFADYLIAKDSHRLLAGYFACFMTAHSVANGEQNGFAAPYAHA